MKFTEEKYLSQTSGRLLLYLRIGVVLCVGGGIEIFAQMADEIKHCGFKVDFSGIKDAPGRENEQISCGAGGTGGDCIGFHLLN